MAYRIYTKRNAKWDSLGGRIRKISSIFAGGKEEEAPTGNKQMMSTRNGLIFLLILHAYLLFSVVTSSSFSSYIRPYNTPSQALHERRRRRSTGPSMGTVPSPEQYPRGHRGSPWAAGGTSSQCTRRSWTRRRWSRQKGRRPEALNTTSTRLRICRGRGRRFPLDDR